MFVFLAALALLFLGYLTYGKLVEKIFGANSEKKTPAITKCDYVDFIPLPTWRVFLIQFLNIAGVGPVFGAILGALYGPIALFWIVLGSIFAGGVHDYMSGMMSLREDGKSLVSVVEKYMGKKTKNLFLIFTIVFLLLLGSVFAMSPADMLKDLTDSSKIFWLAVIFSYYFLATLLPIDKVIGRFYPLFALLLIVVSVGLIIKLFISDEAFYPVLNIENQHPNDLPIFPLMFITIACGALSGFHSTQSPLMSRCLTNEKYGRSIFYGAMITEGVVALIWATLGMAFYGNSENMLATILKSGPGGVVSEVSIGYLGEIGGILAILSVIVLSITSGDTAFRSARLTLGDYIKNSKKLKRRLILSACVLSGGVALSFFDLTTIWMYFGWANQSLATIVLWTSSFYLYAKSKPYWMTFIPAVFMTSVCTTYILFDKIGFRQDITISTIIGVIVAVICGVWFVIKHPKKI